MHSDGGKEFHRGQCLLAQNGVEIDLASAYTPASNGFVERKEGVIINGDIASFYESNLTLPYCPYAVKHVTDGKNSMLHATTGTSPYEAFVRNTVSNVKTSDVFRINLLYLHALGKKVVR